MTPEERKDERSAQAKWPRCLVCAKWHDPQEKCPMFGGRAQRERLERIAAAYRQHREHHFCEDDE